MTPGAAQRSVALAGAALLLACSGAGAPASTPDLLLLTDPEQELPAKLSETGLFRSAPRLELSASALTYQPGYPLWSDGGSKLRALVLPEGASIDASGADYGFPVGTLIFKTFSFFTPDSPDQLRPVETRVLRLTDDGWQLDAYGWDDAGKDAELLDLRRAQTRQVLTDSGDVIEHSIPSRLDCRQCHESAPGEVLGVSELQLAASGSLDVLLPRLDPPPQQPYAALPAHGALTTQVLGYFQGNCACCHNGTQGAASSFDLRPEAALANVIDQPTASSATADGIRVVPGDPESSVLFLGVRGGGEGDVSEVKQMPPLGVALRDASAIDLLKRWITALAADDDP